MTTHFQQPLECPLAFGSDNVIDVTDLVNTLLTPPAAYPDPNTVTATLTITGVTGAEAIAMTHVDGTSGAASTWRAQVSKDLPLQRGRYSGVVVVDVAGKRRTVPITCPVT